MKLCHKSRSCGAVNQSLTSSLTARSSLLSPGSAHGYGTLLVRARDASYTGENILPVEIVAVRGAGDHQAGESKKNKRLEEEEMKTKAAEPEYHSDKHFSNYFLNSNPKLEEMLTKTKK